KMKKAVLLLLILCCFCITSLHAFSRGGCVCLRVSRSAVPAKAVSKVEMIPPNGRCRKTEIILEVQIHDVTSASPAPPLSTDKLCSPFRCKESSSSTATPTTVSTTTDRHRSLFF
uniref:Chemokine interleukin-8-like domain-containing protein n=1 Tax=Oryzias sinensis TaxID=183150 RepID=A0A8C7YMK5_9TELE